MFCAPSMAWVRFILGGVANTAFSYLVYCSLIGVMGYQPAYFFAYVGGIVFSYFVNVKVVFRVAITVRSFIIYPIVYVFQYCVSAILLSVFVSNGVHVAMAPLLIVILTIPMTYVLSRMLLGGRKSERRATIYPVARRGGQGKFNG